nr:hypothetical protein [Bacillus solimangrovi]
MPLDQGFGYGFFRPRFGYGRFRPYGFGYRRFRPYGFGYGRPFRRRRFYY